MLSDTESEEIYESFMWFYGPDGIYPFGLTPSRNTVLKQAEKLKKFYLETEGDFGFDSYEREQLRDLCLREMGLPIWGFFPDGTWGTNDWLSRISQ